MSNLFQYVFNVQVESSGVMSKVLVFGKLVWIFPQRLVYRHGLFGLIVLWILIFDFVQNIFL